MSLIFRKALPVEAQIIRFFQVEMAWETEKLKLNPETVSKGVLAVFNRPELGQYYVCEVDGEVIGSLLILPEWSDWRNGTVWWIHSLYFKPEFRGQGLFSKMYAYLKAQVESDLSACGLRLYVDRTNIQAQDIYAKLGMNGDHYRLYEWIKDSVPKDSFE